MSGPRWSQAHTLEVGEVVELPETGERFEVVRVTPCSATVRPLAAEPRTVTILNDEGAVVRQFQARSGGRIEWSPCAGVRVVSG